MSSSSPFGELTIIAAAALMFMAGAILLLSDLAIRYRQRVAQRVELVLPGLNRQSSGAPAMAPQGTSLELGGLSSREEIELERQLRGHGFKLTWISRGFLIFRLTIGLVLALGMILLTTHYAASYPLALRLALPAIGGVLIGWLLPPFVLRRLARRRIELVERGLPDAIELLVVSVQAGLALEEGIDRVAFELRQAQPSLAEELSIVAADLKLLPSREEALLKFANRIDRSSVRSVMTSFAQTMRYGTPLAQALRAVAAELRNDALLRLEERANRMPVILTIPMVLFMLPAIFLVLGGPAILALADYFTK